MENIWRRNIEQISEWKKSSRKIDYFLIYGDRCIDTFMRGAK